MILNITLACLGTLVGLLIYYVRLIGVVVDERESIEASPESYNRYKLLLNISNKLERVAPLVKSSKNADWAKIISFISVICVSVLLLVTGLFSTYLVDYGGSILFFFFFFSFLTPHDKGYLFYKENLVYFLIIISFMTYTVFPQFIGHIPIPFKVSESISLDFEELRLFFVFSTAVCTALLPYPIAKLEKCFSQLAVSVVMKFTKDVVMLGVKPNEPHEVGLRKVAKESLTLSLGMLSAVLGLITYFANWF
ncbi:hypothetical protein [Aeromonas sp. MR16]|uniref:hypothetical protein n=1 Tax=Aeromonas sp. MR16 TaxID=2923420 RepID=UPI001F4B5A42|nr:hypothetical protein [Aeromonas sp. MR16]MCH7371190.1 hypothetical protein [Aeromonas sp. MR16]